MSDVLLPTWGTVCTSVFPPNTIENNLYYIRNNDNHQWIHTSVIFYSRIMIQEASFVSLL